MSGFDQPKAKLDDASSIKAFLSKIGITGTSSARAEDVAKKVGELNISNENTEANSNIASAIPSTVVSNVASPESKASDKLASEKVSEWFTENAPPDHFKSKNPLMGYVQAQEIQASPQGSPQAAGVRAPPPTPETISSLAIGKMIHDELDRIPEERFTTLGDSKFAPKNQSRLSNVARPLPANDQFFSAVPRSGKPRDDPSFPRMSFKAADTPGVPAFISASKADTNPTETRNGDSGFNRAPFQAANIPSAPSSINGHKAASKPTTDDGILVHGPPSAAQQNKENARLSSSKYAWSQTYTTNGPLRVFTPDTPDSPYVPPHLRGVKGVKAPKVFTSDTPDTPPAAPLLKPTHLNEVQVSAVFTSDTPDAQLDNKVEQVFQGRDARPPLQELRAQENPFSAKNVPHPLKEDQGKGIKEAAAAKPTVNIKTANLTAEESTEPSAGPLTPSSMTFTAVSPTKVRAAGITTATGPAKIVGENLEGALYFKAWPTQPNTVERTSRSAAKHRRIVLMGLPESSTPTFVASLVYGGPLESIRVTDGKVAFVTFLRPEDAMKYYEATANDLLFKKDGAEHVIMTQLGKDVDPVSGVLKEWIEKEFTRCVRAVGVDEDWTMQALNETATKKGRKIEKVIDGTNKSGMRSVTFRFCDIADAVKFKQTLSRAEDWEECNIHFAPDPCADATGIHFE
ncbi:MAG: hypothetical protein Q9184_000838 [Pyrenodesmia sp. 2 TL-2023]